MQPRSRLLPLLLGLAVFGALAAIGWRAGAPALSTSEQAAPATTRHTARAARSGAGDSTRARTAPRPPASPGLAAFAAAFAALQGEPASDAWQARVTQTIAELSPDLLRSALEHVQLQSDSTLARGVRTALLRRWGELEPAAAAGWAASLPPEPRADAVAAVMNVWAPQSLADALAWVRALPAGDARQRGLLAVASEASRTEPVKALELALELAPSTIRDDLVQHAATQLAATDPDLAAGWAGQLEPGPLRERALAGIASLWAETDPAAAATLALQLPPGRALDDALVSIVQRWAQQQPEDAAAWALQFPPGTLRDTSLESVVKLWADRDLQAAGRFLNSLPAGPGRDAAVVAYVSRLATQFPHLALQWIDTIGDATLRARQRESVAAR